MSKPTPAPEQHVLAWLAQKPDDAAKILAPIPDEVFSEPARPHIGKLRLGQPIILPDVPVASEEEALGYLRSQMVGLLTREAGRATRSQNLDKVYRIHDGLRSLETATTEPPLIELGNHMPVVRTVIPTGIDRIDQQIRGLSVGELGIVFMPPGRGKTLILLNFAANAVRLGLKVHYVSVADQSTEELWARFVTVFLHEPCDLYGSNPDYLALQHERMREHLGKGQLWISDYTDRTCSLADLQHALSWYQSDIVFIDHADDVVGAFSDDPSATRHSLRATYMTLKRFAVKYNVPIWTASQSDELSWHQDTTSIANMAEAKVGKATGAAIILGFSGGQRGRQAPGIMQCTIAKARRLFKSRNFALSYDHARGLIS